MKYAICNMQYATCFKLHALCNMHTKYATCDILHIYFPFFYIPYKYIFWYFHLLNVLYAMYDMQCYIRNALYAMCFCFMQFACALSNVIYVMSYMKCALCNMLFAKCWMKDALWDLCCMENAICHIEKATYMQYDMCDLECIVLNAMHCLMF